MFILMAEVETVSNDVAAKFSIILSDMKKETCWCGEFYLQNFKVRTLSPKTK